MRINNLRPVSFCGMAKKAPQQKINNANDAIAQWEVLKHPQYTDIFQEAEEPTLEQIKENQTIRNNNYSFLDKLQNDTEKAKFIEYYKNLTGFPVLNDISKKIREEFNRVINKSCTNMGKSTDEILLTGYDKFCSVGLGNALPGSDLDKGYAVVKGVYGDITDQKKYSDKFKGQIWNNIDNRIMSVNHCAAFPNIVTDRELSSSLKEFDSYTDRVANSDEAVNFFLNQRMNNSNPISSAKFNIWLSDLLYDRDKKNEAKNFAYVIETIRDGERDIHDYTYAGELFRDMNNSKFSWCTNICQNYPMQYKLDYSNEQFVKKKLKARKEVEKDFDSWDIKKQYELIKDIIRSMSGDNMNPEFNDLFWSEEDKHRLLLNDILKGDVSCFFDVNSEENERIYLRFNNNKALKKYYNFNIYEEN